VDFAGAKQAAEKVRTKGELAMVDFAGAKAQVFLLDLRQSGLKP
jgi:hypothetical protein